MTIWAVVPAAGIGSRMQVSIPKQYLQLNGQTVLSLSLARLAALADVKRIMLVLSPDDTHWARHNPVRDPGRDKVLTCNGGDDRWQSVLNGLDALADLAGPDDWVLVHDAVRPCVRVDDMLRLLALARTECDGGLLALPVSDTLKRAGDGGCVAQTVDRTDLWAACTPQLFPFERLRQALRDASASGVTLTDEASAMEWAGLRPQLVPCHKDNIKITYAEDLQLAELILQAQVLETRSVADNEPFAYTGILE
ncbi:2-C-methyl-D-erythritol 4-phosphate cytidylyltransferase [Pseudohongiella sp.]|uniref:2-C-methyl-D-erythritol 4-phosphate cytidylyltransferase n=1 Tax=marine sediment metagenome TaxID=412755 RepID=A0A0F9YI48_9ZZZZ|nr:2-C-methyl-D-erythritol 4-phosphate cytidylyltransferase [Pseudohongiella sp.]HDZ08514.1 2-C-methyl-D-erythritol 4-phosphate cytidylyltransferase [Pseudohongiella sp.]HEA61748.1 2-C-methyl-D-erythritol 4-phosphate cytidylyltransferase [Pseudohongiella sp.]